MKVRKLKIHRPDECRCANCCPSEEILRAARLAQKHRLLSSAPQRVFKPWPAYRWRRVLEERGGIYPLVRNRSRVRPASTVRRVYGHPRWQRWLPILRRTQTALTRS